MRKRKLYLSELLSHYEKLDNTHVCIIFVYEIRSELWYDNVRNAIWCLKKDNIYNELVVSWLIIQQTLYIKL